MSVFPETFKASFRGRPLNGKIENVPSGYTGRLMRGLNMLY